MDGDQYVLVQTVAGFNQMKKLTNDINLIVEAIRSDHHILWWLCALMCFVLLDSPYLQLDDTGTKVRANVKRSVLILREIPESTAIEVCIVCVCGVCVVKWCGILRMLILALLMVDVVMIFTSLIVGCAELVY